MIEPAYMIYMVKTLKISISLRFGHPIRIQKSRGSQSYVYCAPGSIVCYERWIGNAFRTDLWELRVLQIEARDKLQRDGYVASPKAETLMCACDEDQVRMALRLIDEIEAKGIDPAATAASYWRTVHNAFQSGTRPSPYTRSGHRAHQLLRLIDGAVK